MDIQALGILRHRKHDPAIHVAKEEELQGAEKYEL
jgi:hypothetical protein